MKENTVELEIPLEVKKDNETYYLRYYCRKLRLWSLLKPCDVYCNREDVPCVNCKNNPKNKGVKDVSV